MEDENGMRILKTILTRVGDVTYRGCESIRIRRLSAFETSMPKCRSEYRSRGENKRHELLSRRIDDKWRRKPLKFHEKD